MHTRAGLFHGEPAHCFRHNKSFAKPYAYCFRNESTTQPAGGITPDWNPAEGGAQGLIDQQTIRQRFANPKQMLDRLTRLDCPNHTRHYPERTTGT